MYSCDVSAQNDKSDRPGIFIGAQEATEIRESLGQYPLLDQSYDKAVRSIDKALENSIDVPEQGEAGGYEHVRHQQNYREMYTSGLLYAISQDEKYAIFVRDMLLEYASMYPDLGPHPLAHHQAPGRIFHQMLNEAVWLVHTSIAYDSIRDWLTDEDRHTIENNIFRIMIDWFTEVNPREFDRIHNHGTWAGAAIGMIGYVLGDQDAVDKALYGLDKTGEEFGFFRQMDLLFSPDGFYMEGPYYIRYAIMPFYFFAEAIHRNQPELGIYEYRDNILEKALYSALQTTFPNGVFPPINNASKTMDVLAPEVILATNLGYENYGADENLLGVTALQNEVLLNGAGLKVARDYSRLSDSPIMDWGSVEFTDGYQGDEGGLGILRKGTGEDQQMLLMKYGVHGGGHGHFDKLNFIFFDQGKEIIPDYGFARWINIEPKWGGRYLPEGDTYAKLTVAHNTVVVNETSQNEANRTAAEAVSGKRHFFDGADDNVKVMSALADDHYPGIKMQRTMFLIENDKLEFPVIVDLYRLETDEEHQYDLPFHYYGQPINTNLEYTAATSSMTTLGSQHGYQHLWKEAEGSLDETFQFTWLDGSRYYTLTTAPFRNTTVYFGRSGANDQQFNLRSEPMLMLRQRAHSHLFASVIEPHGYFNEARESSLNARPSVHEINVIGHNEIGSVIEIIGADDLKIVIIVNNGEPSETDKRSVEFDGQIFEWTGNYRVQIH